MFPKTINRCFQDKSRVRTLRGSNLEKRRETNMKIGIYFVIRKKKTEDLSIFSIKLSSSWIFLFYSSFMMY